MKEQPLITVITPVFNCPYLKTAIGSVMSQDYPHIQYIIVDDGSDSEDYTGLFEGIQENNHLDSLRVIRLAENQGTVRALNAGIRESEGRYIFNLAADDVFTDEHVLSDWVEEFEETGSMVITGIREVFDETMRVRLRSAPSKNVKRTISDSEPRELYRSMFDYNMIVGCCTAQSRECIERYGPFDEMYRIIEDYPRYLRLTREGVKIHFFDRSVVKYRLGGISSQGRFDEQYEKESDLIYDREIAPFAEDGDRALERYGNWKKHMVLRKQFFERYRNSSKLSALISYGIRDPLMAAQFVQERVLIRIHRD